MFVAGPSLVSSKNNQAYALSWVGLHRGIVRASHPVVPGSILDVTKIFQRYHRIAYSRNFLIFMVLKSIDSCALLGESLVVQKTYKMFEPIYYLVVAIWIYKKRLHLGVRLKLNYVSLFDQLNRL